MNVDEILKVPQFSIEKENKETFLLSHLNTLTKYHGEHCQEYRSILNTLYQRQTSYESIEEIPYLPVSLFKKLNLMSIPKEEVFKTLTSSGTTSQQPSKIFLDRETSHRQVLALGAIMKEFLGNQRMPMLIIDSPNVIKDRTSFSARGAGILGMIRFGRDHHYVLNDQMEIDEKAISEWIEKHQEQKILIFGFTFMVWQYFLKQAKTRLKDAILVHSGGWKKLQEEAISNQKFKEECLQKVGINRVHNFYGMVEQVGTVFVECEEGYFHAPTFAEVIMREPKSWKESEKGVVQVLSILPKSYPGHSLLTEDLGEVQGNDNCSCGRRGKYFQILGRVPKAELRGCSDTHAYN